MTISKDHVKPSPQPDSWKLSAIFTTGITLGSYLAMMTVIFFWAAYKTDFFLRLFGVPTLEKWAHGDFRKLASAVYLQVSIISQALIFVTRARSWPFVDCVGLLLITAFILAQLKNHRRSKLSLKVLTQLQKKHRASKRQDNWKRSQLFFLTFSFVNFGCSTARKIIACNFTFVIRCKLKY